MKKFLILIAVVAACLPSLAQVQITEAQALQLVKNHRNVTVDSANYFVGTVTSVINDRMRSPIDESVLQQNPWVNTNDDKWLIFVDEQPVNCWSHLCTYYYLPKQVSTLDRAPILEVNGCLPPLRTHLACLERNTLIGTQGMPRSYNFSNLSPLSENKYAENTKVLIVWGYDYDMQMYGDWVNCSNFYKVLTTKYLIPKSNIHILMGIGDDEFDVMPDNTPMPKDFDGDGIDESVHTSTPYGFNEAVTQIGRERTDNLVVFYVGGIGFSYDSYNYVLKLRYGEVPADTLNRFLDISRARYVNNVIMNSSASYFIPALQPYYNRTITTCGISDPAGTWLDIIECVNNWTGAFAGINYYTSNNIMSLVDTNSDGIVCFNEASTYAGNATNKAATTFYSNPTTLGSVLSLESIPEDVCLYIRDNNRDPGVGCNYPDGVYWNSPDIWVRNQDDGFVNRESEHLTGDSINKVYIYTRVLNRGYLDYDTYNKYLKLYWKSNTLRYTNSEVFSSGNFGGAIATISLDSVVEADTSRIFKYEWTVPSALIAKLQNNAILDFEILALICDNSTDQIPVDSDGMPALYENSFLAMCRANTLRPALGKYISPTTPFELPQWQTSFPVYLKPGLFHQIRFNSQSVAGSPNLFNFCQVIMELSPVIAQENPTMTYSNMTKLTSKKYRLNNINAQCEFSVPTNFPASDCIITIRFLYDGIQPVNNDVDTYLNIIDCEIEDIFKDAESYHVVIPATNNGGTPDIPIIGANGNEDGSCLLVATNVSEPSRMEWYGPHFEYLGEGETILLNANRDQGQYWLRVVSKKTAKVTYATVTLGNETAIDNVSPNPFSSQFTVRLAQPAPAGCIIRLSGISGSGSGRVIDVPVTSGEQEVVVSASDSPSGIYAVGLYQNGTMIDNRIVIKQ